MTKLYDKVAENFLELASFQRLNILYKLLERSRKRIEPLAKELGATKQEIHRNLARLEQSGLIARNKVGRYYLTTFGRTICVQIPSIVYLSEHREYFEDHDFGDIPLKFSMRAGQLATGTYIKGITKTLEKWKSIYKNADEYIYGLFSEIPSDLLEPLVKKVKSGVKFDYILSANAVIPHGRKRQLEKSGFYKLIETGIVERRMKESVQVVTILNEKEACIFFPNSNGEADLTEMFYSDNDMFHEWCLDYFRYCWYGSDSFQESKLKDD